MKKMKYHPHNSVLSVTFSLEEGLLLLCNPLIEAILKSCLARAQHRHPVTICHFVVESNHLHIIFVVNNPDDVSGFIGYFKTESAHMINRLLGRKKRTIWCEGYDSPVVLSPVRALIAICYLYSNPAKDNLENSINSYPGLSSWQMYRSGHCRTEWKRLRRPSCKKLSNNQHSLAGYTAEAKRILGGIKKGHLFELKPNAWLTAFGITDPQEQLKWNQRITERIAILEERAALKRAKEGKSIIGKDRLIHQTFNLTYRPERTGKRMWCLSHEKHQRVYFINFLKSLFTKARQIREKWFMGDFSEPYPPGLYPPAFPKLANAFGAY